MLNISEESCNKAWYQCLLNLYKNGCDTKNQKYFKDELTIVEITKPTLEPIHPLFPMKQSDIDVINDFIYTGNNENDV
jgi:hypothetical protein